MMNAEQIIELVAAQDRREPPQAPPLECWTDDDVTGFEAPDELVEGMLVRGGSSTLYGDSNTGKTFLAVDIGCAVARGEPWMRRRVEKGLVLYVATESPQSVRQRVAAYKQRWGATLPGLVIVRTPIILRGGSMDPGRVIDLARELQRRIGLRCELTILDTRARMAAGANENSAEDMGAVLANVETIREATGSHVMDIHHCGKDAARGARGWSGARAWIDTELEVTADENSGLRCVEFTKQRDLATKGERVGFRLEPVTLGLTKWGKPATTCVCVSADAPPKAVKAQKLGECEGAILEYLRSIKGGIAKAKVAAYFDGRYNRANVYRSLGTLATKGFVFEGAGMVTPAKAAP